jgi:RimJ/RimL family protein N-acetyltransferase
MNMTSPSTWRADLAGPAKRPERTKLEGRVVSVIPLDPSRHGDALYAAAGGSENAHLWAYLSSGPFSTRSEFDTYLDRLAASDDPLTFALVDKESGWAVGHACYMRIEPDHRVIEVGSILFTPRFQRTVGATEAMYLMARHVFEDLGYRRYEWKCNAENRPSRNAALRLGFTFEGVFRQHMIVKSLNRDTAWFSMLDREWPAGKAAFEAWLEPGNFDTRGVQLRALYSFHCL